MKKILIVGGVAGGATAAARLRRLNEDDQIIMFERGEYISFANCGLPYYIGDVIKERENLLVQTVEGMSKRFNIDIRVFSEVISINPDKKEVTVKNLKTNEGYTENYDELILSPGATPIRPNFKGLNEADNIFTLRNMEDTDKIRSFVDHKRPKKASIIGGGFIGIEMAENLVERGIEVTLIEMLDQVMAPFDYEMAQILHVELADKGVKLILSDGVKEFGNKGTQLVLNSGKVVDTDMTILSIGVKPDNELAVSAGLELGPRGHIVVNDCLETSKPHIYAVGDAVEVKDFITGNQTSVPLASPANRQAHIVADRINGIDRRYKGVIGTSVAKVFDLTAASTGLNEKRLKQLGITDYKSIHLHPLSNAGYYPTAQPMTLKLIFEYPSGKIFGAQAIGKNGVEKRIDVIATAITAGMKAQDLQELELAYAPPFSSAKDPVNMAGYVADNIINNLVDAVPMTQINEIIERGEYLLDVTTKEEYDEGHIEGASHCPVDEIRDRLKELPKDKHIYVYCRVGLRGYIANRILSQKGYKVTNIGGGFLSYSELKASSYKDTEVKEGIACTDNPEVLKNR